MIRKLTEENIPLALRNVSHPVNFGGKCKKAQTNWF